ncbi:MAG: hypothetical protein ABIY55_27460 [Kofleriaceae bacterium]
MTTDGGGAPGSTPDAPTTGTGWRVIPVPLEQYQDRIPAILCTSRDACVIATQGLSGSGKLELASDRAVGEVLVDGDQLNGPAHAGGSLGFVGLDRTRTGVVARADVSGAYVSATGDFTKKASWSVVDMGTADGDSLFLNPQLALQQSTDGHSLFINYLGTVYGASSAPSPSTIWTELWSPASSSPIPDGFADRLAADPTLCDSEVSGAVYPIMTQNVVISPDLKLAISPAGGFNQRGSADAGVCISTDGGTTFYQVPFSGVRHDTDANGPTAVTCLDSNRCFAFNGVQYQEGSSWVYYTNNALMGKASTWTRATVPASWSSTTSQHPNAIFFAPDGIHGWMAGDSDNHAMLLRTTDGGHSWTDVSGPIAALTENQLISGFALDNDHIWVTGERGTLLFTDTASQ